VSGKVLILPITGSGEGSIATSELYWPRLDHPPAITSFASSSLRYPEVH
jgi:hypothetical protein